MKYKIGKENKNYICKECGLIYENEPLAKKCEEWCRKNKSCNMEITSHSI